MKRTIMLAILAAFVLSAISAAHAEGVKLEYKFTENELDKYKFAMTMNMNMPSMLGEALPSAFNMSFKYTMRQRTLEVYPDGSAKVRVHVSAPEMTGAGITKQDSDALLKPMTMTMTMAKDGRVLKMEGIEQLMEDVGAMGFDPSTMISQMGTITVFPSDPVEVGESWTQSIPFPIGGGDLKMTGTLLAYPDQLWNQKCARIKYDMSGQIDFGQMMKAIAAGFSGQGQGDEVAQAISSMSGEMNITGSMVYDFATDLGKLLKGNGTFTMDIRIGMPAVAVAQGAPSHMEMSMDMTMTLTRFK